MANAPTSITSSLPGRLLALLPGFIALSLLAGLPSAPRAYEPVDPSFGSDDPPTREIGVVALGDEYDPAAWMVELGDLYREATVEIVGDAQLAGRLERTLVPADAQRLPDTLDDLPDRIDRGVEAFFVHGNEAGLEELTALFERALDHPAILARRPDLASAVFRAGTVLVRAYRDLDRPRGARGVARDLYRHLPGREPSLAVATRSDLKFFFVERAHVAKTGAELTVEAVGASDCTRFINGTTVDERTLTVAAETTHYLALRCGDRWGPVREITLEPGEYATAPLAERPPLSYGLRRSTYRQRRRTARYLRLVAHYGDVSEVVGVGRPADGGDDAPFVAMRIAPDGNATWASVSDRADVDRAIAELMPALEADPLPRRQAPLESFPWQDFALIGGGATTLVGGAILGALTETGAVGRPCRGDARTACATSLLTRRPTRRLRLARAGYLSALAAGAGLTTWGLVRQMRRHPPDSDDELTARHPQISVLPRPAGATIGIRFGW